MQVVDWHTSVWFPQAIRRHAFIVWLVIHDRLDTQDKLLKWGLINSMACVFCRANVEDRNHLFFGCHFTAGIWMRILRLCGNFRMPRNWENEFLWVMGAKGKPRGLLGVLLYITYGDIATAESMKTTILLERRFFTSYVMMSDLKYQACKK